MLLDNIFSNTTLLDILLATSQDIVYHILPSESPDKGEEIDVNQQQNYIHVLTYRARN
jgi:hypothetical protein